VTKEKAMVSVHEGVLVIHRAGQRIGEERYRDDGESLTSAIELGPKRFTVTVARAARTAHVESGGAGLDTTFEPGAVALENGSFQAYTLVAEAFPTPVKDAPISVFIPSQRTTIQGLLTREVLPDGGARLSLSMHGVVVNVELDAAGQVVRGSVPAQQLEVTREGTAPTATVRAAPSHVEAQAVEVKRDGVALRGELWVPKPPVAKVPVVVFIAGSGPTDRDGNSAMGLQSDAYRLLASALADRGIASLRFDKRGVGQSGINFDPAALTLDDFVADAAAMIGSLRGDPRFGKIAVLGHSEGGLIALKLATDSPGLDSVILLATAGRPLAALLHEQLASKVDATTLAAADKAIVDLRAGNPLEELPPALAPLFHPAVRRFLKSELDIDPVPLTQRVTAKLTVIQGEHDAQVTMKDATLLAHANKSAKLVTFSKMNHVLKDEISATLPQASYTDPSLPLSPGLADAVAAAAR
jgi:hypothetical protein